MRLAIVILLCAFTAFAEDVLKNSAGTTQTATISTFPSPVWMTLSTAISTGATTVVVKETPLAGFNSDGLALMAEPYTTNAELRAVSSLSSLTFTVAAAFKFSHASNANVLLITDGTVSPVMYGAVADGTADDWRPVQRACLETEAFGALVRGGLDSENRSFGIRQPVFMGESRWHEMRFLVPLSYPTNLVQTVQTNVAAVLKTARQRSAITAFADTNTILYTAGMNFLAGQNIAFNNPYGETLPGGIISGRLYKIKTLDDTVGWMTISDTESPSTELDITSNGTGYLWGNMHELTRVKWDKVRLALRATNLNGVFLCIQQQSYTRELRVDMEGPSIAGSTNRGIQITGQVSTHHNMECDPDDTNQIAVTIDGGGHRIDLLTVNGNGNAALEVTGRNNFIGSFLAEQVLVGVRVLSGAKDFKIGGWYWSSLDTNQPFLDDVSASTSSYELGSGYSAASNYMITRDASRGYTNRVWDGSADTGSGDTDNNNVYPGHFQFQGNYGPVLRARRTQNNVNNNRSLRHIDEAIWFDSTAASRTGTLSRATGWMGLTHVVGKATSANSVYVEPLSGQTINGSATAVQLTNQYQVMRFVSDGATNWRLMGN